MSAVVKGVPVLKIHGKTYNLNRLVAEKATKDQDIVRILEAKFRIEAEDSVPEEMLREFVDKLGDLTVKDLSFGYTANAEQDSQRVAIFRGPKVVKVGKYTDEIYIDVVVDYHEEKHYHLQGLATYLTNKTFAEAMSIMKNVKLPFNVFDNVSTLILEGNGLRVRFGCQDDCRLTLHYSSDPAIYQWFGDLCERYDVRVNVGVCGKVERVEKEYKGSYVKTGKTEKTDWTCLV